LVLDGFNKGEDLEYNCSQSITNVSGLLIEFDGGLSERSNAGDTTVLISTKPVSA